LQNTAIKIKTTKRKLKNMKNKCFKMTAAVAAAVCIGGIAQAVPINGDITFVGGAQLNSSSAGTATEVLAWTGSGGVGSPTVLTDDGSFAGIAANTAATFTAPWSFNSGPLANLWTVGGFTFNLISSSIFSQGGNPAGVIVDGTGTVSGNGFTPTTLSWSFSASDPSAGTPPTFSFQAAAGSVPDGGTTVMLLGAGLLALGLCRKTMFAV
jgi:hypothetical protein